MKRIKIDCPVSRDEQLGIISNHELVNDRVKFDEKKGKPHTAETVLCNIPDRG